MDTVEITYSALRKSLESFLDRVVDDREVVVVKRRGARDVAIIAADELASIMETEYLLRSPKNAQRLREALRDANDGKGKRMTVEELCCSVGFENTR